MKYLIVCLSIYALISKNLFWNDQFIEWQKGRKLGFEDFRGKVQFDTSKAAESLCLTNCKWKQIEDTVILSFNAVFDRDSSWIRIKDSDILKHEQLHFDIAELSIRYLYKDCLNFCFSKNGVKGQIDSIFSLSYSKLDILQDQYDEATSPGVNDTEQLKWTNFIKEELNKYSVPKGGKLFKIVNKN